jgi:hypothetical protein
VLGGNRSRAKNGHGKCRKPEVLDGLPHDLSFLSITRPDKYAAAFSYFNTDAPGMGCDEQNGLPVSMGKMQRQPVRQGLLTPQLPPHVAELFASLRNCRAETVPAHKTPITSKEKNIDLIFLFMIAFLLVPRSKTERSKTERWPANLPVWLQ